ncbi:hypothetical protein TWF192_005742 [Orbilia oligospora]|nr:hypothetical protein TWF192_005742 [Orbilia oligospora]
MVASLESNVPAVNDDNDYDTDREYQTPSESQAPGITYPNLAMEVKIICQDFHIKELRETIIKLEASIQAAEDSERERQRAMRDQMQQNSKDFDKKIVKERAFLAACALIFLVVWAILLNKVPQELKIICVQDMVRGETMYI